MEEKYEQFVDYFRKANVNVRDISEHNGKLKLTITLGDSPAEIRYDRYMVSIVHYIAPIRERSDSIYNKIYNLDSKFNSIAKIGLNCGRYKDKEYLYCAFANFGNNDPYADADSFFDSYNNAFSKIKDDLADLLNYL